MKEYIKEYIRMSNGVRYLSPIRAEHVFLAFILLPIAIPLIIVLYPFRLFAEWIDIRS